LIYLPGDLLLGGLFPMHEQVSKAFLSLTLIRMTKDEKVLAIFKGLLL
jgi:hypothetical protein